MIRGNLSIEFGGIRHQFGPIWLPDGLHIWWRDRGVHLYWKRSRYQSKRIMRDRIWSTKWE